ncbi:hypothetical protein [Chitinophaga barathri]|uniref:Uncharacterized protein n=1 Tax=Chitinophaga barathri TaxID=1647451 RepID=A0A3N4M7H9_9BACT|nr:hypothetical protein [Chitinophaga barathri]RPD39331.1 hypothetical protein EG028_19585 [Chitinophaga barathri]
MDKYLYSVCSVFDGMPLRFREHVCWALGWSKATFYRRLKINRQLSPAERFIITQIAKTTLIKLLDVLDHVEKDPKLKRFKDFKLLLEKLHLPMPQQKKKGHSLAEVNRRKKLPVAGSNQKKQA